MSISELGEKTREKRHKDALATKPEPIQTQGGGKGDVLHLRFGNMMGEQ